MSETANNNADMPIAKNGRQSARWWTWVFGVGLVASLGVLVWRWAGSDSDLPSAPRQAKSIEDDEDDLQQAVTLANPGYVGPQVCGECHGPRLREFQQTRHFRACWAPEPGEIPLGFAAERTVLQSRYPGLSFEMKRSATNFTEDLIRAASDGENRRSNRIDFIYGFGGQADEVFFTWKGDRLFELPVAWLHPVKQWGEQPYDPHGKGDFTRTTTTRCVECHNTWVGHVRGSENRYRRDGMILGVTCEKCHGPAAEHVAYHRQHPSEKKGYGLVHPGRLSRERQMDVCAQCHSNAMIGRDPAFSYRPGEPLDSHFRTLLASGIENDHVADQAKYLRQSKCFQKTKTLTCVSCHDPHRPTDVSKVQSSCQQCHQAAECRELPSVPEAIRGSCVDCHMPRYDRVEVKFHTREERYVFPMQPHNHRIGIDRAAAQATLLAWYRRQSDAPSRDKAQQLTRALSDHWIAEGERLLGEHRYLSSIAAFRRAERLLPTAAIKAKVNEVVETKAKLDDAIFLGHHLADERRHEEAIATLEGALKLKPDSAQVHGKLGTLYAIVGRRDRAEVHLREVARNDADDPYGYNMLGWLVFLDGDAAKAVEYFRLADEIFPFSAEINYRWGSALFALDRWPEAATRFRQVLLINPDHAGACRGLSHALRNQGALTEGLRYAKHAARLTSFQNAEILLSLMDAYADTEQWDFAVDAGQRALDLAQRADPKLVPRIQGRLLELRRQTHSVAK
jgi:tetratricopeptide (TPR) repeat protein